MALTLSFRPRTAGVLLAVSVLFVACGGGGGGGDTPPVTNPPPVVINPPVDSIPPQVMSITPNPGATDVAPTTSVEATYNEALKCDVAGQTVQVAGVDATVLCNSTAKKMALSMRSALPADTVVTATIPAATDMAGNTAAQPVSVTFRTAKPAVVVTPKLYVGNMPSADGSNAVTVVDVATGNLKHINFPAAPGFGPIINGVADHVNAEVFFAGAGGYQIYVLDAVTDTLKSPIKFDSVAGTNHQVRGMVLTDTDLCVAMSGSLPVGVSQNHLRCWNRVTNVPTFEGANNSLAAEPMFTTGLRYVMAPTKKLYAISALRSAYLGNTTYSPGTAGTLTVLHPTTYAVEKTLSVGSVPVALDVHPTTGEVWVANAGDNTISIVNPTTGVVETMPLPGFADQYHPGRRPAGIKIDVENGVAYVTDNENAVVAYDLATRQERYRMLVPVAASLWSLNVLGDALYALDVGGYIRTFSRSTHELSLSIALPAATPVSVTVYAP